MMRTTMTIKKSRSYNQQQLKILSDYLCEDIDNLLDNLNVGEYKTFDRMIAMRCPIHGGDNNSACNLYYKGDSYRGNWKCRTHQCEETFKGSIIGFIRGCLSKQNGWTGPGDPTVSFNDAVEYAINFTKKNPSQIKVSKKEVEKNNFVNIVNNIQTDIRSVDDTPKITRDKIVKNLKIPSDYFISRGFSSEILIKYDVGECLSSEKEMGDRAVVPVYDDTHEHMVGCSGRSIFTQCSKCKSYHNLTKDCPNSDYLWQYSKWKHNKGFKTQEYLYNLWYAKDYIQQNKNVVLVESPGNVWRLEEAGIHNSVALFGSVLQEKQKLLLDISGAMSIYILMDNDDAGKRAAQKIYDKCHKTYNVFYIDIDHSDVADMSVAEVKEIILPQLKDKY
jgi:5S rRNA maturation endonuclease (ribonuclease M5)